MTYCLDIGLDIVSVGYEHIVTFPHFPRLDEFQKLSNELLDRLNLDEGFREAYLRPAQYALNRAINSPDLKTSDVPYIAWRVTDFFKPGVKPEPIYFAIWVKQ